MKRRSSRSASELQFDGRAPSGPARGAFAVRSAGEFRSAAASGRAALALTALLLAACGCGGGGSTPDALSPSPGPEPFREEVLSVEAASRSPLPQFVAGRCRVYTSEPGWRVFVDANPVAGPDGRPLLTPCEVVAAAGTHTVTVVLEGKLDQARQALFGPQGEAVFDTTEVPDGDSALLGAPLLELPVGTPQALTALNSAGAERDPFVTRDGLAIYFAADRPEGRGIYTATRPSPLHPFEAPRLLEQTSGIDRVASPSLDDAGLQVIYVLPDRGRIRALARSSPLSEFEDPRILFSEPEEGVRLTAAQVHGNGDRLHFCREQQGRLESRVVFPQNDARQPFGKPRVIELPGRQPRLSADALRQYLFDGRTLRRARRATDAEPFVGTEPVRELTLPKYVVSEVARQFCVSDDEQWLYYCDDPAAGGDLWLVRLASGPAWGVPVTGGPAPPRVIAAAETFAPRPVELFNPDADMPTADAPPDPRTQPLPYVRLQEQVRAAAAARDFGRALELLDAAAAAPELASSAALIAWDREEVAGLVAFWSLVEETARSLKPGDRLRIGAAQVEFERFDGGVVTAKGRTTTVQKRLLEFDTGSIVALVDQRLAESDETGQLRAALFLSYCGDGKSTRLQGLLKEAGALGTAFEERRAAREQALAEQELARENIPGAIQRLADLESRHPKSQAQERAAALREQLYARTEWRPVGPRQWDRGPEGAWIAGDQRAEGAALVSPQELDRFELTFEYRIQAAIGHGGVYFKYGGSGRFDDNALKIQFSNDAGQSPHQYATGSLFGRTPPMVNAARPMGEWNTFRMIAIGNRVRAWINGQKVLESSFVADEWPERGLIVLDGVRGGIAYRRIVLSDQPLPAP